MNGGGIMGYLITQSLLSAWQWTFQSTDPDAATADFMRVLRRERGEPSPAMIAGNDFEALCYSVANGCFRPECGVGGEARLPENYHGALQIARVICGGQYQVKAYKGINVEGQDFLLFGILDALKAGTIYDIKYKTKSFGSLDLAGSYTDSPQHPMYFRLIPEAERFSYLVSDGTDLYVETYERGDVPPIESTIGNFMTFLDQTGLEETYRQFWTAKR